jgi:hypothetical protein
MRRCARPARRGHYFVLVADAGHVLFEYTAKETSDAVRSMFAGYRGYVQADAKSVYDILYRGPPDADEGGPCVEVACYAHLRRKFWEAALAKDAIAREGLARIGRIFDLDATWRHKPPSEIQRLRAAHLRPHADAFFAWTHAEYERVRHQRGLLRSALGYAVRQKDALMRVFEDGRLLLDNNRSERALRGTIATGRKAWLFVGSDDHGQSAAHHFTLIASCRLHALDPEAYLRDFYRVLPYWPKDRTSNSPRNIGLPLAPASTPPSSLPRSDRSLFPRRSNLRPNNRPRRTARADNSDRDVSFDTPRL